ncbi:MAG: hypothetical protein ACLTAI_12895 [Thomasclavelia sp.]
MSLLYLTPVLIGQAIDLLVGMNQVHFQCIVDTNLFVIGIVVVLTSSLITMDHGTS